MTLDEALQWAQRNCTAEATARIKSRQVVKALVDEVERLQGMVDEIAAARKINHIHDQQLVEIHKLRAELTEAREQWQFAVEDKKSAVADYLRVCDEVTRLDAELVKLNRGRELYKDAYDELYDEIERLRAELAALKQQEPAAWMQKSTGVLRNDWGGDKTGWIPLGLVTAPQPSGKAKGG